MKPVSVALLVLAAVCAFGQQSSAMDEIDGAFASRMTQQSDKWFEDGHFPVILQMLRVKQEWHPLDEETATDLGWMYKNVERHDLEWLTYMRYSKRNPTDKDHLYPLANFYYLARSYVNVVATLSGIERQNPPPHPNSFRMLAHSYAKLGLHKDSLRVWDAYIKIAPDDLQAKNNRQKEVDIMSGKIKAPETIQPEAKQKSGKQTAKPSGGKR